jgi:hypothetical protein
MDVNGREVKQLAALANAEVLALFRSGTQTDA